MVEHLQKRKFSREHTVDSSVFLPYLNVRIYDVLVNLVYWRFSRIYHTYMSRLERNSAKIVSSQEEILHSIENSSRMNCADWTILNIDCRRRACHRISSLSNLTVPFVPRWRPCSVWAENNTEDIGRAEPSAWRFRRNGVVRFWSEGSLLLRCRHSDPTTNSMTEAERARLAICFRSDWRPPTSQNTFSMSCATNRNPNAKSVYDNSNRRTAFHPYEYECAPERRAKRIDANRSTPFQKTYFEMMLEFESLGTLWTGKLSCLRV